MDDNSILDRSRAERGAPLRSFVVGCPELGEDDADDGETVQADDAENVARERASRHFYRDPTSTHVLLSRGLTFHVFDGGAGEFRRHALPSIARFHVSGEPTISWMSRDAGGVISKAARAAEEA